MRRMARVTMSMRELDRLKCIQAVIDGELYPYKAAERLGISTRQLRRLAERYRAEGPTGLISRRCSRPSNNRLEAHLEQQIVNILRESYADFGPTLAAERTARSFHATSSSAASGSANWGPMIWSSPFDRRGPLHRRIGDCEKPGCYPQSSQSQSLLPPCGRQTAWRWGA